jgi:type VI secretion system protein VasG
MLTLTVLLRCLSSAIREALLQALNECAQQQIAQVQISHLFLQLLKQPEPNELIFLLDRYDISVLELRRQLNTALLSVHIQKHSTLVLSEALIILLQQA